MVLFVVTVAVVGSTQSGWLKSPVKVTDSVQPGFYRVDHYVDGDTITVRMNGAIETVRFIGVDTPETHRPNTPVQCYGPVAAAYTQSRISSNSGQVRLQADKLDTNRDRYGRLLRYIYLADGTLLDEELVQKGYGFAYLGFPFEKSDQFAADQTRAQSTQVGLWGKCKPTVNKYGGYTSNPL